MEEQIRQLQSERDDATKRLIALSEDNERLNRNTGELLKLRGEVGSLRRLTNELATTQSNEGAATILYQQHKQAVSQMPQVALALRLCAGDSNWQYATNFDLLKSQLQKTGRDWLLSTNFATAPEMRLGVVQLDSFEFVNPEAISSLSWNAGRGIVLRERIPYKTPDGKWERVYGLADGSTETAISEDGNFDAWEKQHMSSQQPKSP